jgi:DNA invertase Pin-like site-specific DNA recombinase
LERVRREGKKLGRPVALADPGLIRQMREQGTSWSEIARRTRLSRGTVQKVSVKAVT